MNLDKTAYRTFARRVLALTGIDLAIYRPEQMARRIKALMERRGASDFHEYARLLANDAEALGEFTDRMTINVSELFRNPEKFGELRDFVFPELLRHRPRLKIWSAGCSYGAEPYSMAIILAELTPGRKHSILGTDIDETTLARAKEAVFSRSDLKDLDRATVATYFDEDGNDYRLKIRYRRRVEFSKHDLLANEYGSDYDLITCRNVVIYFTEAAKHRVYSGFLDALRPGGYLFVGGTERIADHCDIGYESPRPFFYRKPAREPSRARVQAA